MLFISADIGVGHCFFLSLITSWWQIDQGFTGAAPLSWCGVSLTSQEGKATSTKLVLSFWQEQTKPRHIQTWHKHQPFFCHTWALGSGEFGPGSLPRGNRMAEKHFWKLKVKTWQWKSCYSCLTCGLWMAHCPIKPFPFQLKIAQASLLIVLIATIFRASATIQTEGLIQR